MLKINVLHYFCLRIYYLTTIGVLKIQIAIVKWHLRLRQLTMEIISVIPAIQFGKPLAFQNAMVLAISFVMLVMSMTMPMGMSQVMPLSQTLAMPSALLQLYPWLCHWLCHLLCQALGIPLALPLIMPLSIPLYSPKVRARGLYSEGHL